MDESVIQSLGEIFSVTRLVATVLVLVVSWFLIRATRFLSEILAKRFVRYRLQISRLFPVLRLAIWTAAILIVIAFVWQPPQGTFLAIIASVGLAVGLSAQDIVRNVLSGIVIVFNQPYRLGDMIQIGSHYGEVVSIDLHSTRIRTFNDDTVTLPNAMALNQAVSNSNTGQLHEMISVTFSLPATVDVAQIKELAREAAASSPYAYLKQPILVTVEDVFDRTFLTRFTVKSYVLDVRLERLFASDILERIKKTLQDRNLLPESIVLGAIRFPQVPSSA